VRSRPRNGLPMAKRKGDIVIRSVTDRIRNEHVPGDGVEGVQYGKVVDSARLEALDQASPVAPVGGVYPPSIQERTSLIRR
jgi:hypothetical protein